MKKDQNRYYAPGTGECSPTNLGEVRDSFDRMANYEIIYVGDPMCSWCWGISDHLKTLKKYYSQHKFSIVVGGLRPGGGDAWDDKQKEFLKHHWQEVTKRSGQPFGYKLFDREAFNYDTEPACQAVVVSRRWLKGSELTFFEAVSRKFYVENEDPSGVEFYESICKQFGIPFSDFVGDFESKETRYATCQKFQLNRQWGVRGYPTVLFKTQDQLYQINHGYTKFNQMKLVIEKIRAEETAS